MTTDAEADNMARRVAAQRLATRVARDLEELAERIRQEAALLSTGKGPASVIIANIVSLYTQAGNTTGTRLWSMVRDLDQMK